MLNKTGLRQALIAGEITCQPIYESAISIGSIDVRLADRVIYPKPISEESVYEFEVEPSGHFKIKPIEICYVEYCIKDQPFTLLPGQFILASTMEKIGQPGHDHECVILGKSSLARLGLSVEIAGLVEATNELNITLEIFHMGSIPIRLQHGMHIAQVRWNRVEGASVDRYEGKYKNTSGVGRPQ